MKRLFTLAAGLGAGVLLGAYAIRRLEGAKRAVAPTAIAGRAGYMTGELAARLQQLRDQTRAFAATREAQLRQEFDVPRIND